MYDTNTTLVSQTTLPKFSQIAIDQVENAINEILSDNRKQLQHLLSTQHYSWNNLLYPLEALDDRLHQYWSLINHLHSVADNEALRNAYSTCLPLISEYSIEIGQNTALFEAVESIAKSEDFKQLTTAQQKAITNALRDFQLSGVHLPDDKKKIFKKLTRELSSLSNQFQQNTLDATQGWIKHISDEEQLAGLPEHARALAADTAKQRGFDRWLITLEPPSYLAIMQYADNRELREEVYTAQCTRASDQGPNAGKWDNSQIMIDIMEKRQQIAAMLNYQNFAELSLVPKMAESTTHVMSFLNELRDAGYKKAQQEAEELKTFAADQLGITDFQPWDVGYASEKLRQQLFDFSQEELRPYFPEPQVLNGLFNITQQLYGIKIKQRTDVDTWHPDVKFFELYDESGTLRGQCYFDLYARLNKRGGAWMDDCRGRRKLDGATQTPIAFVNCNFSPPIGEEPSLFTHEEVLTVFHEFGHALQHLLTTVDVADVAGISGVAWDAVELPSQFFENWCWQADAIPLIAKHYKTGEALPDNLLQKMRSAKNFQSAIFMMRQLEFALFDFRLHSEFDKEKPNQIQTILDEVRQDVCVLPIVPFNRFQNGFSHIFGGGYSAGYYSYKWAEVLSSDAFSKFEEEGIFNADTGRQFLHNILEKGGSEDAMDLFVKFRGRKPTIDALLRHEGIKP